MQRRTAIIIALLLPFLLWFFWTLKITIQNLPRENDIAGTRTVDGKTQCYFFNDPDTYEDEYFDRAGRYFNTITGFNRTYTLNEIGISFQLPQEYNYYVFQQNYLMQSTFVWEDYHDIVIMPFSDIGCVSAFLHNSIAVQKKPWAGMPGGEVIKEPNPDVIFEEKVLGGRTFDLRTVPNDTMPAYLTYYITHNGLYYSFTTGRTAEDKFVMEELLKSLVFLDEK